MNFLMRAILICGLIAGLAVPAFAAEDKSSVKSEKREKAEAEAEKSAAPVQKEKRVKKLSEENFPDPDPEESKAKGTQEMLQGRVSGAGYNGLAVELPSPKKGDPSEIWFNYVKGVKLSGAQSLSDIEEGDTVGVSYKEGEDGRKFLKEIRLIRKKPAGEILVSTETPEETEE